MERELVYYLSFPFVIMTLVVFIKVSWSSGSVFNLSIVYQWGSFRHGLLNSEYTFQRLIFHFYKGSCLICSLRSSGHNSCNPVTYMSNLSVEKSSVMGAWLRISLTCLHIVDIRAVEGSNDFLHSVNLLSFAGVDGIDVCMGKGASQHMEAIGIGRNLILHKDLFSRHQGGAVNLIAGLSDDVEIWTEGRSNLTSVFSIIP